MFGRMRVVLGAALVLSVLAGCSASSTRLPVVKAQGKVSFQGKPAAGAFVSLYPVTPDPKHPVNPRATVGDDGTFVLTTYEKGDGAPVGEYNVALDWKKPLPKQEGGETEFGPCLLPARYQKPETSGLRVTVAETAGIHELPAFDLKR